MIDWLRVRELHDEIGGEDFREVVTLFLSEVEEVIARLRTAPDPAALEEDMHFLKGSALNLGFRDFGALCQDGERAARAGEPVDLSIVLCAYDASVRAFLGQLDAALAA